MRLTITIIFLFMGTILIAQSTFKKGYYIDRKGAKTEGFFMVYDGNRVPEQIIYKIEENSSDTLELKKIEFSELKIGDTKIREKEVFLEFLDKKMIAKKENNTRTYNLNPETLLLNVLLEFENFALYSYTDNENDYFFIETEGEIELLKYKKITENYKQITLSDYRKQLHSKYKINDPLNQGLIGGVKYHKNDLTSYFVKYATQNNFHPKKYKSYTSRSFKDAFNITPKIGYSQISHSTEVDLDDYSTSFESTPLNFGLDIEYFQNTISKNSSIILSYEFVSADNEEDFTFSLPEDSELKNTVQMHTIRLKYRRYIKLVKNHYLYADGGIALFNSSGETEYIYRPTEGYLADLEFSAMKFGLTFSVGYNYDDIYLELNYNTKSKGRYDSKVNVVTAEDWYYETSLVSLSIGYALF